MENNNFKFFGKNDIKKVTIRLGEQSNHFVILSCNIELELVDIKTAYTYQLFIKQDCYGDRKVSFRNDILWDTNQLPLIDNNENSTTTITLTKIGNRIYGSLMRVFEEPRFNITLDTGRI